MPLRYRSVKPPVSVSAKPLKKSLAMSSPSLMAQLAAFDAQVTMFFGASASQL